ncbi:ATP-binding protein [Polaribacter sp. Z014]|uniref:hybrid sensor histidine kinase/response regulator transcription factor n=1 Tax=Polaribacter sp. Z014 TaxID=2927126 RepID=UPI00202104E6|nr:hybrid sensor histidine kinase/response regulator transcription factor [Polaribacter sp. Z014]MCL7762503.1 ATP-binding protein [Polaribacter sp. Z014]
MKNKFKFTLLIIATFVFFIEETQAQDNIYFEHITTQDGLSQNDVNSIYQDKQGYMWFGTHDGLNKYDGYNFTTYNLNQQNPKSINSNLIFTITGDDNNNLWIGTSGSGLNFFNRSLEEFTHFKHDENNINSIASNTVRYVFKDSKNRLWICTYNGLDLLDLNESLSSIKFKHITIASSETSVKVKKLKSLTIFEDSNNNVWVGTDEGLFKLIEDENGKTSHFEKIKVKLNNIKSIKEDKGRLFFGANSGLYVLDLKNPSYEPHLIWRKDYKYSINHILFVNNQLWAGSASGLILFDNSGTQRNPKFSKIITYKASQKNGISKNTITSLFKDRTGIVWVGTNGGGINKFYPGKKQFKHVKNTPDPKSLSYDKVRAIYEDSNGSLWVGTEGGSLNMLPKQADKNNYYGFIKFPKINNVFTIDELKRGDKKILLLGEGSNGTNLQQLDITDPDNIKKIEFNDFSKIKGSIFSILEDSDKNIWIGTYNNGINRSLYNSQTKSYKNDVLTFDYKDSLSVPSHLIRNILEDKKGNIWFGTGDGLCVLSKTEKTKDKPKFTIYKSNADDINSISHNYILELFESEKGDLWIGTFGGGFNKYVPATDSTKVKFISYKTENGLPNNVVKGILEDDDHDLWISTNKGLSKFNENSETFMNYDVNDGLQDDEFQELARCKRKNGQLLFGGVNGFNVFEPKDIKNDTFEAETVVTNLLIANKPIKIGEKVNGRVLLKNPLCNKSTIDLNHNENSLSFEFAAFHYGAPEKNEFAYKLEGFNKDWVYTDSKKRFATYTNLSPGNYTLKVKASNNDKLWDSTPFELNLKIAPPFWLTKFAYFLYLLLIIGILLLYRRYTIISTSKKHSLELEHVEKEKTDELQRIKLEFFTNITHEFTTPLTLIKGPLNFLQKEGDNIDKDIVKEQYKLMQKNTDYLLRLISQLLDFRKMNQGQMRLVMRNSNIVQFIKEVSEPFQFLAQKNLIEFTIESTDNQLQSWFDHDTLEKIINNLLSNAFKFTPDKGSITINISRDNKSNVTFKNPTKTSKFVYIQVKDSGTGMDETKIESIFERFFSEKNKEKKDSKGMGIGLAFVKDITELHQGEIRVISKHNEGTNFIVRLPIEKKAYLNIPEITCKETSESDFYLRSSESDSLAISINDEIEDQQLNEKSKSDLPVLLVVDDNEDIRTFIKLALGKKYKIYTAENGEEGLKLAGKIIPKIIISDIMMPVMDGIEFCNKIKTKKETSHIPVVLLTAKLSKENEKIGLRTGADAYIRKPFDVEILDLKLNNILNYREELRSKFNLEITLQPKEITVTSVDERFLQQAMEVVEKHMTNTDFNVEMLIKEMGYSRTNLYTKFKEITGLSSSEFIRSIRLKRAVQLFEQSDLSVKEIMYMTGFNTASYFAKCFKKQFGVIPSEYVKQKNK